MSTSCECCFRDYIAKCNTEIAVYARLEPSTDYRWVITDKFENKFQGVFTTNTNGYWQIPVEELPAGLLTEYSGQFSLQVYGDESCKPIKFLIAQEYDCIDFTVSGGTFEKNNLGCQVTCIEEPEEPGE